MVGKPKQAIPKGNVQPIPAVDEPFSRIIIAYVSPLPNTKSGCQYLLTIMFASKRLPEDKDKKALVTFFAFVGLP